MVERDELGVCMFSHGLQCVVEGSRQMPEIDLTWSRINSGGTDVLKTNGKIDELTNGTWQNLMPWKQINETLKPDGLFYIQFTKTARPVILQYESDGTSKEASARKQSALLVAIRGFWSCVALNRLISAESS